MEWSWSGGINMYEGMSLSGRSRFDESDFDFLFNLTIITSPTTMILTTTTSHNDVCRHRRFVFVVVVFYSLDRIRSDIKLWLGGI